jgi:hypothetical protein
MEAGRELDALIAEKVMGLKLYRHEYYGLSGKLEPDGPFLNPQGLESVNREIPNYSKDIAAAWEVVKKIVHPEVVSSFVFDLRVENWPRKFKAKFSNGGGAYSAIEDSAPLAICLAALKAVENE